MSEFKVEVIISQLAVFLAFEVGWVWLAALTAHTFGEVMVDRIVAFALMLMAGEIRLLRSVGISQKLVNIFFVLLGIWLCDAVASVD